MPCSLAACSAKEAHSPQGLSSQSVKTEKSTHASPSDSPLNHAVAQPSDALAARSQCGQDVIPVEQGALLVDQLQAIGVAIERDAQVGGEVLHGPAQARGVESARLLVDVASIRLVVDHGDPRA